MASDLSSGCDLSREGVDGIDEKEEGEISLEDVSSSEEGQPTYGYGANSHHCPSCLPGQVCPARCLVPTKFSIPVHQHRSQHRREVDPFLQDAVHGKENLHYIREPSYTGGKHTVSTLQEKNDDLVPISSDSDMEIVGLLDNSVQVAIPVRSKGKKKKKKKRGHASVLTIDDFESSSSIDVTDRLQTCLDPIKHSENLPITKASAIRMHRRDLSPVHKSTRTRVLPRTPPRRHRSPPARSRSPYKRTRSPIITRTRSPLSRRSPRKQRSPRRSPLKSTTRKQSHLDTTSGNLEYPTSHANVQKLLKKVRQLDAVGTQSLEETLHKHKEHASSLKDKLLNMMKGASEINSNQTNYSKEQIILIPAKESNDADEEDDLALLRQKALETKQKKSNLKSDQTQNEVKNKTPININDDQDEEDLQLRMIALRSAVLKKHQNRVQKGAGKNKKPPRSESPFTQSFLDSIPIPDEQLLNFASPPHTPPPMNEISHTEDMDLDTDVEREKEKLPYSPTDKITSNIPIDTELLGIQLSDVSFISLNDSVNNQSFRPTSHDDRFLQSKIIENQSYLPSTYSHEKSVATSYIISNNNNNINEHSSKHSELGYPDVASTENQQLPYSPTDTPICDPDIPQLPFEAPVYSRTLINCSALSELPKYNQPRSDEHLEMSNQQFNKSLSNRCEEQYSAEQIGGSGTNSLVGSPSPASLITIDDLPETDTELSSVNSLKSGLKNEKHIPTSIPSNNNEQNVEPLYMQGVPDVSKDSNKIPTLINRTLVPASILKSNKQLQKPLITRKIDVPPGPLFKSAEMQPVSIEQVASTNSTAVFKPMKFPTSVQKIPALVKPPVAFNDLLQEDFDSENHCNRLSPKLEANNQDESQTRILIATQVNESIASCTDEMPTQKKEKSPRKGVKRKSSNGTESLDTKNGGPTEKRKKQNGSVQVTIETLECEATTTKIDEVKKDVATVQSKQGISKNDILESVHSGNCDESKQKETVSNKDIPARRQSLDEDEDTLRAILLASLPNRSKATENTSNISPGVNNDNKQSTDLSKVKPKSHETAINSMQTDKSLPASMNQKPITQNSILKPIESNNQTKENKVSLVESAIETTNQKTIGNVLTKKRSIMLNKVPQRKMVKKLPISASTKVVNNAKKYQNAMMQKRLNLQKVTTVYNSQKLTGQQATTKVQTNEAKWSASNGKMNSIAEPKRIVINLQSDTESDSDTEAVKNKTSPASNTIGKPRAPSKLAIEFEKNLDQFLRDVRKKQESVAATKPSPDTPVLGKRNQVQKQSSTNLHTPLAVRHLPASQQAEYRRLKQQILEHEKLKIRRAAEMNALKRVTTSNGLNNDQPNQQQQLEKEKENSSTSNSVARLTSSTVKQPSTGSTQISVSAKPMTNLSIRISNENTSQTSPISRTVSNSSPARTVTESGSKSPTITQEIAKVKAPMLRVLTGSEINRKFVQVQVKHDTNERIVTINGQNNQTESTISQANRNGKADMNESNMVESIEPVLTEISPNNNQPIRSEIVDTVATTVVLRKDNQSKDAKDSVDSNQSTIVLSRRKETDQVNSKLISDSRHPNTSINKNDETCSEERTVVESRDVAEKEVKETLSALGELSAKTQAQHLEAAEQKLVMKRYSILNELAEMSGNLRHWHMERDLQTYLAAEVKKLREQLRVAEERLQVQRDQIKAIGPKVVAAHKKINASRQECFKLSKICSVLGTKVVGKQYKIPDAGAHLLEVRLKEVANHTRQLSRKKVSPADDSTTMNPEAVESKLPEDTSKKTTPAAEDTGQIVKQFKHSEVLKTEAALSEQLEMATENDDSISKALSQTVEQNMTEQESSIINIQPGGSSTPIASKTISTVQTKETIDSNCTTPLEPTDTSTSHTKSNNQHCRRRIAPYVSILTHMKVARNANPNGVLCPYELMGTCNDGDCQFVHQIESQAK